ncbi:MAG: DUF222 domain-containing protein, partial [Myxococcales bacterium]|nr:DUF222 domain-containing protein [Myxococcales bacterium]
MTTETQANDASAPSRDDDDRLERRRVRVDRLADEIATLAATIDATTHRLMVAIRSFDDERGWALQGARSCAQWLSWRTGRGLHAAREWVRVARALDALPKIDDALERGAVSFTKVRAITRVATPENEATLLAQAETATGAQLERVCTAFGGVLEKLDPPPVSERRYVRRRTRRDGMISIEARLWPDEAEMVMQALRATKLALAPQSGLRSGDRDIVSGDVTAETPTQDEDTQSEASEVTAETSADDETVLEMPTLNLADAIVVMADRQLCALERDSSHDPPQPPPGDVVDADPAETLPRRPSHSSASPAAAKRREITVLMRHSDIREGQWMAELHDGTALSGETFCRLACDSGLVMAMTNEEGDPLDVGRRRRSIPAALLRALWIRDGGCRFPGCRSRALVEAHHLEHWAKGGATNKANTVLLCHNHHQAVHEGGFSVRRQADGSLRFYDPSGRWIPDNPEAMPPGRPCGVAGPGVNLIRWDGRRARIRDAVQALVWRTLPHGRNRGPSSPGSHGQAPPEPPEP